MKLVIDASIALKWFLANAADEQNVTEAVALLAAIENGDHEIVQPPHWLAEVISVLARRAPNVVSASLTFFARLPRVDSAGDAVLLRAAEMSARLNHHLFDTLYHAVALEHGGTLVTADERYFGVAKNEGSISLLVNFAPIQSQSS